MKARFVPMTCLALALAVAARPEPKPQGKHAGEDKGSTGELSIVAEQATSALRETGKLEEAIAEQRRRVERLESEMSTIRFGLLLTVLTALAAAVWYLIRDFIPPRPYPAADSWEPAHGPSRPFPPPPPPQGLAANASVTAPAKERAEPAPETRVEAPIPVRRESAQTLVEAFNASFDNPDAENDFYARFKDRREFGCANSDERAKNPDATARFRTMQSGSCWAIELEGRWYAVPKLKVLMSAYSFGGPGGLHELFHCLNGRDQTMDRRIRLESAAQVSPFEGDWTVKRKGSFEFIR